jgi:hypothetical protein
MRTVVAALVGGLVMFAWGAFSHMVLPIGEAGIRTLPDELAVVNSLKASVPEAGLYFFPGMGQDGSKEEMAAWQAKYEAGPIGLLVYRPTGRELMSVPQMAREFVGDALATWLALLAFGGLLVSASRRVAIGAAIGLAAWFSISFSYWNWYEFPLAFVGSEALEQVVGWALTLLVAGAIARRAPRAAG